MPLGAIKIYQIKLDEIYPLVILGWDSHIITAAEEKIIITRLGCRLSLSPGHTGVKTVGLAVKHAHNRLKPPSSLYNVNPESMVISACVHIGAKKTRQI